LSFTKWQEQYQNIHAVSYMLSKCCHSNFTRRLLKIHEKGSIVETHYKNMASTAVLMKRPVDQQKNKRARKSIVHHELHTECLQKTF